MIVGFDLDDVAYPWTEKAHALCVEAGITNGRPVKSWRCWEDYGCEREVWAEVIQAATVTGELYLEPPILAAHQAIDELIKWGHEVHLITARATGGWPNEGLVRYLTEYWLRYWSIPYTSLTFASDKPEVCKTLGVTHFIDDGVHNYEALDAAGVEVWLMDAPHNQDATVDRRLFSPLEFVDVVKFASTEAIAA